MIALWSQPQEIAVRAHGHGALSGANCMIGGAPSTPCKDAIAEHKDFVKICGRCESA
jgi:hypothetical protein